MSEKDEISAVKLFEAVLKENAEMRKENKIAHEKSQNWREANDKAFETFLTMYSQQNSALQKSITAIEITMGSHSDDIAFVNDLKRKATWGWNTAKFATIFIAGAFAFFAGLYHFYEFLKEYFTGIKHG